MHRKVSGSSDEGRGMCVQKMKRERREKKKKRKQLRRGINALMHWARVGGQGRYCLLFVCT
jgi:hypothetical protein